MNISPDLLVNAGTRSVRLWVCSRDSQHLEPWRGEVEQAGTAYRPCKICKGRMSIRAFKITGKNQIEEFRRRRTDKQVQPVDPETGEVIELPKKLVKIYKPKTVLRRLLRKLTGYKQIGNFKNMPNGEVSIMITRRTELLMMPVRPKGDVHRRCLILIAEPSGNSVRVICRGIAGWVDDIRDISRSSRFSISKILFQNADILDGKQYKKYLQELKKSKKKTSRKKKGGQNATTHPFRSLNQQRSS